MLVFVGTYTRQTAATGIYAFDINQRDLSFSSLGVNDGIDNPSWLIRHPTLPVIYAVNEVGDYDGGGAVSAFNYSGAGDLELIGQKPSLGKDPCHLAVNSSGTVLFVSNYSSGSFASYPLSPDGSPGELSSFVQHNGKGVDPMRQKMPHVHSITVHESPDAERSIIYVADLGIDRVIGYPFSSLGYIDVGAPLSSRLKPGAGPRHFCFDSKGRFAYLINELDNTIVAFDRNKTGKLIELETYSTLPPDFSGPSYCAHIALSNDCRFLYASNRGHDSIVVFRVGGDGDLSLVQWISSGGKHPRHFVLTQDNTHLLVANRDSDNIVIFERDVATGELTAAGVEISTPTPVSICFG